ncbi:hypothetical protein CLD22_01520 [Rubrivivax gelatinosus]|nr:hypothetical protein [Rubrivivax gelatinosus]
MRLPVFASSLDRALIGALFAASVVALWMPESVAVVRTHRIVWLAYGVRFFMRLHAAGYLGKTVDGLYAAARRGPGMLFPFERIVLPLALLAIYLPDLMPF